jgi:hypothetical protein
MRMRAVPERLAQDHQQRRREGELRPGAARKREKQGREQKQQRHAADYSSGQHALHRVA